MITCKSCHCYLVSYSLYWVVLFCVKILVDQLGILTTSNMVEWLCHYERIIGLILIQISYFFTLSSASESDGLQWGGVPEGRLQNSGVCIPTSPSLQCKFLCLCKAFYSRVFPKQLVLVLGHQWAEIRAYCGNVKQHRTTPCCSQVS